MEKWIWIKGYEGLYKISNQGRIKSFNYNNNNKINWKRKTGKIRKSNKTTYGYSVITLSKIGVNKTFSLSRLVAKHYILNQENKPQINHKDGNKENNCYKNLEWVTPSENQLHRYRVLFKKSLSGEKHPMAKLTWNEVIKIRTMYKDNKYSYSKLAKLFHIKPVTVFDIIKFKHWKTN